MIDQLADHRQIKLESRSGDGIERERDYFLVVARRVEAGHGSSCCQTASSAWRLLRLCTA